MITYPLTLPTVPAPKEQTIEAVNHVAETMSPFTGTSQTQEWTAEYWNITQSYPPMTRAAAAYWIALFVALRGKAGWFWLGPEGVSKTPRGVLGGTPKVNGSNAAMSKTLATKGWTPSTANVICAGDYFQVGNQLFMSLTDVNSDGSGNATVDVFPRLRVAYADNTAVITTAPKGLFRLKNNNRKWTLNTLQHFGLTLEAHEAF